MTGKHRQPEPPVRIASATARPRTHSTPRPNVVIGAISASVATAGVLAAAAVALLDPAEAPSQPAAVTPAVPQSAPLHLEGRLIAVADDSVTARAADGATQTYRVTRDTLALTREGGQPLRAAPSFAVNDEVAIMAIVQNGTPVATTVADREVTGLNGPPMDSGDLQPLSTP